MTLKQRRKRPRRINIVINTDTTYEFNEIYFNQDLLYPHNMVVVGLTSGGNTMEASLQQTRPSAPGHLQTLLSTFPSCSQAALDIHIH